VSPVEENLSEFERNARTVLEASVRRLDGRTRSRLNQARHAALEAAQSAHRPRWRSFTFMPAAGAAVAAALLAAVLWQRHPASDFPLIEAPHSTVEDLDLLADSEGLDLIEGGDGSFYEWAAAQGENGASDS
jgi:hypothetical protein